MKLKIIQEPLEQAPQINEIEAENEDLSLKKHVLEPEQQKLLQRTIDLFPSFAKEGLGKTSLITHKIKLKPGTEAIKQRYFPVSPAIQKIMHEEIKKMLDMGVIEECHSPWSSPVVLVKKDDKFRLCLDSRKLNQVTEKDAFPTPLIDSILSRLPKAKYISAVDLKKAFWQIPLEESSRPYTAFTVPGCPLYQYRVMPFGLTNAPSCLSRLMHEVIPPHLRDRVMVYLDDLLIMTETFEEHIDLLTEVAYHIRKSGLTLNIEKSNFCLKEVSFLGYKIGYGEIKTDPDKVSAIVSYPIPTTVRQVRRFLGMAGWYRRFITNFASLSARISDLLKKATKFCWTSEAQTGFEAIKSALTEGPVLVTPDFNRPFTIQCDASSSGVGGVLTQLDEEGNERPIAYVSQKLSLTQKKYTVTEQECLAAIICLKKFRPYVEGQEFQIITDHASLKWLMSQSDLNNRLARWSLKMQGYNFTIDHRKGKDHVVPDALSRTHSIDEITELEIIPPVDLESPAFQSEEYQNLVKTVESNSNSILNLKILDNNIFRKNLVKNDENPLEINSWKLWLPRELIVDVIREAHDSATSVHGGIHKTLEKIQREYYWPKMYQDVREYINNCSICKETKPRNNIQRPPMYTQSKSDRSFQKIYSDLIGPYPKSKLGNVGALIVLDNLTKFPLLFPLKNMKASGIIKHFENDVFSIFGVPEKVWTDNGKQFTSHAFQTFLQKYGVDHTLNAFYSPHPNASERVNRTIVCGLRIFIKEDQRCWDENLHFITMSIRSLFHQGIDMPPYSALFGQHMVTHGDNYKLLRTLGSLEEGEIITNNFNKFDAIRYRIQIALKKAFEKNSETYNLRSNREANFQVGQEVYRKNFIQSDKSKNINAKLAKRALKARIEKKLGNSVYLLSDLNGKHLGVFHAKDIYS
jgi:hypothetical protein